MGGLILFIIGMNASDSAADRWSNFFTGHFTDITVWYLVGGGGLALGLMMGLGRASHVPNGFRSRCHSTAR